ncbi:MAG: HdeD family acid-resistance protein [Actinomycetales bacterium]
MNGKRAMRDRQQGERTPGRPTAEAVRRGAAGLGDLWWWFLARGLLAGLLGICLVVWPGWSVEVLTVVLGFFLLIDGVAGLVGTMRVRQTAASLAPALISLVIGGVLLLWPGATLRMLLIVVGVWALVGGLGYLLAGFGGLGYRRAGIGGLGYRRAGVGGLGYRRAGRVASEGIGHLRVIGATITAIGIVLVLWPASGIVTVAWILAGAAFVIALVLIFLAMRLKRLRDRTRAGI